MGVDRGFNAIIENFKHWVMNYIAIPIEAGKCGEVHVVI